MIKNMKYKNLTIWPTIIYGFSAGRAPIQVSNINKLRKFQNKSLFIG